jgi:hypothetical protein
VPIDAQIPLMGRPVQFDPLDTIGRLQQLRSIGLRNQAEQQTIAQNQQTLDDNRAMGDAIQRNTTADPTTGAPRVDTQGAMAELAKSGHGRAFLKLRDDASKWDEQQYRTFVERGTATKTGLATIGQTFNGVTDQASYDQALGSLHASLRSAPPEVQASLSQLPPTYDPRVVDQIKNGTLTVTQHADLAMKIAAEARKAPGETADSAQKVRADAATTLANAKTADEYRRAYVGIGGIDRSTWDPREDGSPKGDGFFGVLKRPDGGVSSEISVGVQIDGKEVEVPALVPTLTKAEVQSLLTMNPSTDKVPDAIVQKAADYAKRRMSAGQPVFAKDGEQQSLYPDLPRAGEVASQFPSPEQWTPQTADEVVQRGLTPNQRLPAPGVRADAQAKQRANAAVPLYAAALRGPEAYRGALTTLDPRGDLGFPPAEAWSRTPAFFGQIRALGTTTTQAESAESAAAGRAETARHNRVTELASDPYGMAGGARPSGRDPLSPSPTPIAVSPGAVGASVPVAGQPSSAVAPASATPAGPQSTGAQTPARSAPAPGDLPVSTGRDESVLTRLPRPVANDVKALVDGRRQMTIREVATPYGRALLAAAEQYDPSFDAINYNARSKVRTDFTSGTSAKSINALNTVIGHLDSLSDAGDRLNNSSVPIWNSITNLVSKATGNPQVDQFTATRKAVVDELTRVWRGSGGSEGDIKSWSDAIDASQSPAQLHGVIAQIGELLASKMSALSDQYAKGMGVVSDGLSLLSPKAKATLERLEQRSVAPKPDAAGDIPAAHAATPYRVGDVVMVKGQRVRVTKLLPNGQYEGEAVKE